MKTHPLSFEQGPIRPPSEAHSLLLRFTRNCNWNNCLFCPVYKGRSFSRRTVEEVKADIDAVAEIIEETKLFSWKMGKSGQVDREVAQTLFNQDLPQSYLSVVAWMYYSTGSVFIQDANNLILKADDLVDMLNYLHEKIKGVSRVTSYARSSNTARKTQEDLNRIRAAGLDRIHVGMESGYDALLKFMKKGVTAEAHIKAGQMIKKAGMELSEYYMPGLGGKEIWKEHAIESARVLNAINPDFIRLRTLRVPEQIELYKKVADGEFTVQHDDEVIEEIRLFIESLEGITSFVASDHMMNLLQDVEGYLPRDKAFLLETIDRYLDLTTEQRIHYRLGRRMGQYQGVADMARPELSGRVNDTMARLENEYPGKLDQVLNELANRMI